MDAIGNAAVKAPKINTEIPKLGLDYSEIFKSIEPVEIEPVTYEDSIEHEAVDDIEKRLIALVAQSSVKQRKVNIALIVIGVLTLLATVAGVILQFVK